MIAMILIFRWVAKTIKKVWKSADELMKFKKNF